MEIGSSVCTSIRIRLSTPLRGNMYSLTRTMVPIPLHSFVWDEIRRSVNLIMETWATM